MNLSLAQWAQLFGEDETAALEQQWHQLTKQSGDAGEVPLARLELKLAKIGGARDAAAGTALLPEWPSVSAEALYDHHDSCSKMLARADRLAQVLRTQAITEALLITSKITLTVF